MALSLIGTLALGLTLVPSNLFVLAQVAQAGTVVRRYNVPRNAPASDYHRHKRFSGVKRTLVDTIAEEREHTRSCILSSQLTRVRVIAVKKRDMDYYGNIPSKPCLAMDTRLTRGVSNNSGSHRRRG